MWLKMELPMGVNLKPISVNKLPLKVEYSLLWNVMDCHMGKIASDSW